MESKTTGRLEAPEHLGAAGRALWDSIAGRYGLEPWEVEVLREACEARDREVQARETLDREGLTVPTAHGVKTHPAAAVERDARAQVLRALNTIHFPTAAVPGRDHSGRFAARGVRRAG